MKTSVHAIPVKDGTNGPHLVSIRMPNGDLKRKLLMSLLRSQNVQTGRVALILLEEVLTELDRVYHENRTLKKDRDVAFCYIENLIDRIDDLEDEAVDLGVEIMDLQVENSWLEHSLEEATFAEAEDDEDYGIPSYSTARRRSVH